MHGIPYEVNPYGGAVIDTAQLPENPDEFAAGLPEALLEMKSRGLKVVWLSLPVRLAALVPPAVASGFLYHHADNENLQLTCTLIPGAFIPPYATHYIGAGGVVVDDRNRLLVITEKYRLKWPRHYKLPGGALNQGEHIADAVCREVFEETGIQTEFQYLSCFRHWHGYRYGKSDIYFVCRLNPVTYEITPDPEEIEQALWMPVDEYLSSPETHPFNRKIVQTALSGKGLSPEDIEDYGTPETHELMF